MLEVWQEVMDPREEEPDGKSLELDLQEVCMCMYSVDCRDDMYA